METCILVISHGNLCEELVRSAEMIMGTIENVETLPLQEGVDPEEYMQALEALLEKHNYRVMVLADLFGGTPFNSILRLSRERDIPLVTGANLPLLLEVANLRDELEGPQEVLAQAASLAIAGMRWQWDLH